MPTQEFFFDLQLWQITVLQPFELWGWKVAHIKAPSNIYCKNQHISTFNIRQDVLKSANLLHKWGLGDSQLSSAVVRCSSNQNVHPFALYFSGFIAHCMVVFCSQLRSSTCSRASLLESAFTSWATLTHLWCIIWSRANPLSSCIYSTTCSRQV